MAQQRLDKIIASTGRYSRREVKTLVREGRVLVDGRIAASAEDKCDPLTARISVNGEELFYREHTYVMLHKPAGVLSATEDGRGETVLDLLAPEYRKIGLFPVGRLDKDTEGLLLLTDDGALAHDLLAPKKHVDKVYFARTDGALDEETLFTINKFFENNLILSETARKLFVHRNTLVYRLEKIKKLTGLDLREFDDAITFKVALMVKKYLASRGIEA